MKMPGQCYNEADSPTIKVNTLYLKDRAKASPREHFLTPREALHITLDLPEFEMIIK
jgi:hypothetical protein